MADDHRSDVPAAQPAPPSPAHDGHGAPAASRLPSPIAAAHHSTAVHPTQGASRRRIIVLSIVVAVVAAALYFGIPAVRRAMTTVSTDDAYVNGHVTFVAPRVAGQVVAVNVDDNDRVKKGDVLVELDRAPFKAIVDAKAAALAVARSNVDLARNQVRAMIGQARANRYGLQHAIEEVNNQIALLGANVAALNTAKAKLTRAELDYRRAIELQKTPGAITQQDFDAIREAYQVAQAQVQQALQQVYQTRVSLGLPEQPEKGESLTNVPPNLSQNFSTVRQALANLLQSAAPLNIVPTSYDLTPQEVIEEFYKRDPEGNVDRIYADIIAKAPQIAYAKAQEDQAEADLKQAQLNLDYCTIVAEIDGVVTRRNVNPGNNVAVGQSLMAVRSLTDVWVDANFKETQLRDIRIGQPAELEVDMYGSHQLFRGRVQGFTFGTGSTLALLPAENATGNFVKVVQRLPVRIELLGYDPVKQKQPLFIGLSVEATVLVNEKPEGPNAGEYLRPEVKRETAPTEPVVSPNSPPPAPPTGSPPPNPRGGENPANAGGQSSGTGR